MKQAEALRKSHKHRHHASRITWAYGRKSGYAGHLLAWERQAIADAYLEGEKIAVICEEFRVSESSVNRITRKLGVPCRPRAYVTRSLPKKQKQYKRYHHKKVTS